MKSNSEKMHMSRVAQREKERLKKVEVPVQRIVKKDSTFIVFALVVLLVRLWTLQGTPIYAIGGSFHDDRMMVELAQSIGEGGPEYDQFTLVKGWMFPLFLAVIHKLRIPYIQSVHLINAILGILAVYALCPGRKGRRLFDYVLYTALLFNPAFTSGNVLMRVYRNAFSALMAFAVVVSLIAVYMRRYDKLVCIAPWGALACIALPLFWYTREDSIWLMPFIIGVIVVTVISVGLGNKRRACTLLLAMSCPLFCLEATTQLTRYHRQTMYGEPIVNELSEGEFTRAMKAIYAVDMEAADPLYVAVSREKIRILYANSRTLRSMEEILEKKLDEWSYYGRVEENRQQGEVENGWFFWCLRDAVAETGGFESLSASQEVFGKIADEIEAALDAGKLNRRAVMFSALMPPWTEGTQKRLVQALTQIPDYIVSFSEVDQEILTSIETHPESIWRFEQITNNHALRSKSDAFYKAAVDANLIQKEIQEIYRSVWPIVAWMGRYCAILTLALLLISRNQSRILRERVWILTGIAGALLVLYGGVAYNHAESCQSINVLYLSAAYPLAILFDLLGIESFIETIGHKKTIE